MPTRKTIKAYVEISKPRILTMVLVTATLGFYAGGMGIHDWQALLCFLLGTAMTSAGAGALNHLLEIEPDSKMERTKRRPLPTGVIPPMAAMNYGILMVLGGTLVLQWQINLLTAFLALLTSFLYVVVYTPMKRITWLNTLVGAIPGAIPPLGGWAAATGQVNTGAWVLFAILFVWQQPHFYAIAWMFRDDYRRGGFKMLPVVEPDGRSTFRQIVLYSLALIPISLLPSAMHLTGIVYSVGVFLLGIWMLSAGITLARSHSIADARRVLKTSVIYLPLLLALFVADGSF